MKRELKVIFALFFVWFLFSAQKTQASEFSLGVYPPIIQIQASAPVAIRKDFTVVNASENPEDLHIVFKSFTQSPYNNGQPQYTDTLIGQDKDIFSKMQILDGDNPITNITLGPKQKKGLTLHIGLPKDEPAGDYYFSIILLSNQQLDSSNNGSHVTSGIATNVLLSVGPKDKTVGFLQEFSSPWFLQSGPVSFTVLIQNTSNHYITPLGHITIRNMFGQLIGIVNILPVNVLSNTTRYMTSQGSPTSKDLFMHPVVMWNEKTLFGPYRASLVISLASDGPIFTKTLYFFAMPISFLIGIFLAIVILSIIIVRVRQKMKGSL